MRRRQKAFESAFQCFVTEGKVMGVTEFRTKYPHEAAELRNVLPEGDLRDAMRRFPRIFASRWAEIGAPKHQPKVKVKETIVVPEPAPKEDVSDALAKLRKSKRKVGVADE